MIVSAMNRLSESEMICGGSGERELPHRLRAIMDDAPSDSSAVFYVRKGACGLWKALLKIRSRHGTFLGAGQAESFEETVEQVACEAQARIVEWRRDRFAAE